MSRNGKIARLPRVVRDELNRRLLDGEQGGRLVEWLNEREDVQAVLKADFGGCPITEQNLSRWRQGGFEAWQQRQASLDVAGWLVEETDELQKLTDSTGSPRAGSPQAQGRLLGDRAADMAALSLAELLMATRQVQDGAEKERSVLKIVRGLVRLRRADRDCERGQREAEAAERAKEIHSAGLRRGVECARQPQLPVFHLPPVNEDDPE